MQDAKRQAWQYIHWTKLLKEFLASPEGTCKNDETHTWSVHVLIVVKVMNIVHWAWYLAARLQWVPISSWVATGTTLMSCKEVLCSFFCTVCRVTVLISSISTYHQHGISSTAHIYTNPRAYPMPIQHCSIVCSVLSWKLIAHCCYCRQYCTVLLPAFFVFPVTALLPIQQQCFCPISRMLIIPWQIST
jgi:hypothetical protein